MPIGDLRPSAVVLVASVKALKHHGGTIDGGLAEIETGAANLARHIGIIYGFGLQALVGVNKFPTDTQEELDLVRRLAVEHGAYAAESTRRSRTGGKGAVALAEAVIAAAEEPNSFDFAYPSDAPIEEKIRAIVQKCTEETTCSSSPRRRRRRHSSSRPGWESSHCMAKTHSPSRTTRPCAMRRRGSPCPSRPAPLHRCRLDRGAVRRH